MSQCITVNIQDMLKAIGEEELQRLLSDFSSPLNEEVEDFVHNKAIEFAKKKLSITYLVIRQIDSGENLLVGIFTLAHKAVEVTNVDISNTARRKLERYAKLDEETNRYNVSAFLIAQFGKNSSISDKWEISGNELMDITFNILEHVQYYVGGGVVYLDCEDIDKVLEFYQSDYNRFKIFGERKSKSEGKKYLQLLRFF
ncbi:MAG: GNAT family acetyltransferase [Butyrivibrio sp.]|nr:GNAT family acetyltransferase [Butyrivibrio sp.]